MNITLDLCDVCRTELAMRYVVGNIRLEIPGRFHPNDESADLDFCSLECLTQFVSSLAVSS